MSATKPNAAEQARDLAVDMANEFREALTKELEDTAIDMHAATGATLVQAVEMRVAADMQATGQPLFLVALVATKDGKDIVIGGRDLLKRYYEARIRMMENVATGA